MNDPITLQKRNTRCGGAPDVLRGARIVGNNNDGFQVKELLNGHHCEGERVLHETLHGKVRLHCYSYTDRTLVQFFHGAATETTLSSSPSSTGVFLALASRSAAAAAFCSSVMGGRPRFFCTFGSSIVVRDLTTFIPQVRIQYSTGFVIFLPFSVRSFTRVMIQSRCSSRCSVGSSPQMLQIGGWSAAHDSRARRISSYL
jgi:hypothetical protein